jgi:hypothetical protein
MNDFRYGVKLFLQYGFARGEKSSKFRRLHLLSTDRGGLPQRFKFTAAAAPICQENTRQLNGFWFMNGVDPLVRSTCTFARRPTIVAAAGETARCRS